MYGIISDIHSNLEALNSVLNKIRELGIRKIACLGDVVGYYADPDDCVESIINEAQIRIRGNHDKAVCGILDIEYFNDYAKKAIQWTRQVIREENKKRLINLEKGPRVVEDMFIASHGSPVDEDSYIFDRSFAEKNFEFIRHRFPDIFVCFFGHTHVPIVLDELGYLYGEQQVDLKRGTRYLINPGSVGQPRDGNYQASFGIFDEESLQYTNVRVRYDVTQTKEKVYRVGLPRFLADRLVSGR